MSKFGSESKFSDIQMVHTVFVSELKKMFDAIYKSYLILVDNTSQVRRDVMVLKICTLFFEEWCL